MKKAFMLSLALTIGLVAGNSAFAESYTTYKIQSGDTFWALSKQFNVGLTSVLAANPQVDPANLYVGEIVNIPIVATVASTITAEGANDAAANQYTVQSGDNFWIISQKLNTPWNSLIAANPSVDVTNMYVGMKINLPPAAIGNTVTTTATDPTTSGTKTDSSMIQYMIQSGDTYWLLSQKFNVSLSALLAANPAINPSNLYIGLKVNIPTTNLSTSTATIADGATQTYLADGQFPLKPGTYSPFTDTYGDGRTFNPDGTVMRKHEGDDIMAKIGTPIYSAYDGTVINKGWNTLGGWRLTIKTPDGKTAFYYAHMSAYASGVEIGSKISKGKLIGYVGNTGYGPEGTSGLFDSHLHFGMYDVANGFAAEDPYNLLKYWEKNSLTAQY